MTDINNAGFRLDSIESLAENDTMIHRLNTATKIITTFLYVVIIVSFHKYQLIQMIPFMLYPPIMMRLAGIGGKYLLWRLMVAVPFCLFAGIANLIWDREICAALETGASIMPVINITWGMISFTTLMLKCLLTISAVLILIATTRMSELARQLVHYRVPAIFVLLITLVYRYISVILEEGKEMYLAYILRSGEKKGIRMKDMGVFLGQLVLKSMDRADRVYCAMKCRGFTGDFQYVRLNAVPFEEKAYIAVLAAVMLICRLA